MVCDCHEDFDADGLLSIKPNDYRSCTDIIFLALFGAFWVVTFGMARTAAVHGGDINIFLHGYDYEGNVCGSGNATSRGLLMWPYPPEYSVRVCVASCNETQSHPLMSIRYTSSEFLNFCIPQAVTLPGGAVVPVSSQFGGYTETLERAFGDLYTVRWLYAATVGVALVLGFVYAFILRFVAGLLVWLVIAAIGAAMVLCSYLLHVEWQAVTDTTSTTYKQYQGFFWLSVVLTIIYVCVILYLRKAINIAIEVVKEAGRCLADVPTMIVFPLLPFTFICAYFVFWLYLLLEIASAHDVNKGVTVPPAARTDYNVLPFGTTALPTTMTEFVEPTGLNVRNLAALHVFGLLWNAQFLVYFGYAVLVGACADWYFTPRNKEQAKRVALHSHHAKQERALSKAAKRAKSKRNKYLAPDPDPAAASGGGKAQVSSVASDSTPDYMDGVEMRKQSHLKLVSSLWRTIRFHLGTVAVAALIIAAVNMMRVTVEYIDRKTKGKQTQLAKAIICMSRCCLKCLECCLNKISKNALIWTAVYGDNFFSSSCKSFLLLFRNIRRVAAINLVGAYLLTLGKLVVAMATTALFAMVLIYDSRYAGTTSSIILPTVVCFGLAFIIAWLFMSVYDAVIDTIFLCFLIDEEKNGKDKDGVMLASKSLQDLIGKHQESSKEMGQKILDSHGKGDPRVGPAPNAEESAKLVDKGDAAASPAPPADKAK